MATSGSYNYSVTGASIIESSLRKCGMLAEGETASSSMSSNALGDLERLTKALQKDGIRLWKYEEMILFLVASQQSYDLGPTGGNWLKKSALTTTALASAASSGATTITVDSASGVSTGDYIGVVMDDTTIHWTTVNGAPAGAVITLTVAIDDDAAVDNAVYVYTSKGQRPVDVSHARVQVDTTNETIVNMVGREDYFQLSNKAATGTPVEAHYNPLLTNGKLYLYPTVSDERQYLNLTVQYPLEDFDSTGNNPDFPQEWYLPLVWLLAQQIYIEYGVNDPVTVQKIEKEADKWYEKISNADDESASLIFGIDYTSG